jgi:kynurenine formamidase
MAQEAWGLWGAQDEMGAPNRIGAAEVQRAAALVRSGQVIPLAQPLHAAMPVPGHRAALMHFMGRDGGDYAAGAKRPGGFQFAEDTVVLPLHLGTHVDALCHAWCDDQLYNGFPGNSLRSTTGAQRCGVDKLPPIVTRGILLDCTADGPLPDGTPITRGMLAAAAARAGVMPEAGDAVLLRTGWLEQQAGKPNRLISFDTEPGLDEEGALWLAEAGVALVGADNFAIEALPFPPGKVFPVHQRLLRDHGIPLLEGVVLKPLAEAGATAFLFMAAALPLTGATGSPLTPVAVL